MTIEKNLKEIAEDTLYQVNKDLRDTQSVQDAVGLVRMHQADERHELLKGIVNLVSNTRLTSNEDRDKLLSSVSKKAIRYSELSKQYADSNKYWELLEKRIRRMGRRLTRVLS